MEEEGGGERNQLREVIRHKQDIEPVTQDMTVPKRVMF